MKLFILFSIAFLQTIAAMAQKKSAIKNDSIKTATLQLTLTNKQHKALIGEEIIVAGPAKNHTVITAKNGVATLQVPVVCEYTIKLKTIDDTTIYGNINIPPLQANQFYTTPFKIDMVYEPAKQYVFHNLEFDVAKAIIKPISYSELNLVVEYLNRKETITIEIAGHTDNIGNDADNKKLSQQRADAVKIYLLKKGIKAERIITIGYGAAKPIADNNDAAGRQKNR